MNMKRIMMAVCMLPAVALAAEPMYTEWGAKVTSDVKYTGYARNILSDYLYRLPDGTPYFLQNFTVSVK